MLFLRRAAPGAGFGVLFGLVDAARVIRQLHTISLQNLLLLLIYAILSYAFLLSALFIVAPLKLTDPFRSRISKIVCAAAIGIAALVVVWKVHLPAHKATVSASSANRPSIILISVDTLRRDHVGCYGYVKAHTPNIDRLAKQSALFEDATTPITLTGPSHVTMLTGDYPITHGVGTNGVRIGEGVQTLPQFLERAGYRTAAFVSGYTLKDESVGLSNRFGTYDDEFGLSPLLPDVVFKLIVPHSVAQFLEKHFRYRLEQIQKPGSMTTRQALSWINQTGKEPFFLFVHYFDAHGPHVKPSESRLRVPKSISRYRESVPSKERDKHFQDACDAYDQQISYADSQIGNLLAKVDQLPRPVIVIFTADHGESLTEHGFYFDHGVFLYETCVRVPMMIRFPDRRFAGNRIATQVSLIDLAPTILEAAGIRNLPVMDGRSLFRVLDGSDSRRDSYGDIRIGSGFALTARYYVRSSGFKLIWNYDFRLHSYYGKPQSEELYDLKTDPGEKVNLIQTVPDIQAELTSKLTQFLSRDSKMRTRPDPQVIEQLRALGYTQ